MPALDEKQIQERLYGQYRKGTLPLTEKADSVELLPRLESSIKKERVAPFRWVKPLLTQGAQLIARVWKMIPWRAVSILAGSLIASAILFQTLLLLITKVKTVSLATKRQVMSPAALPQTPVPPSVKQSSNVSATTAGGSRVPIAAQNQLVKQREYAVQVCTYEREEDARQLVNQLTRLNFSPFYRRTTSVLDKTRYEVFLGREKTYANAKALLDQFRKTKPFQNFSDAFIRST